jgi:hypothetical protein
MRLRTIPAVPTFDAIELNLRLIKGLPREALENLQGRWATVKAALDAELQAGVRAELTNGNAQGIEQGASNDELLDANTAAAVMAVTVDWLYRHGKQLGLAVQVGDASLRFSSNAIQAYIRAKTIRVDARRRCVRLQAEKG